jgi:hypothetical protein
MTRLERKNRTPEDLGIRDSGGVTDLMDNMFKSTFRVNDDEMDYFCEHATNEEMNVVMEVEALIDTDNVLFKHKKDALTIINRYVALCNNEKGA